MGFEGHVFDAIRRTEENRRLIQQRRDRMKSLIEKMNEKSLTGYPDKVQEEGLDQIRRDIVKREYDEKMYYFRFTVYFVGIILLVMFVVWGVWKLW